MKSLSRRSLVLGSLALGTVSAKAAGQLQLVMFDRVGCPWCAMWDKEVGNVYHKTWEGERAPLRRLSMHPPYPSDLAFIKDILYSPTFVLVKDGREIGRIVGYPGEAHFYVQLSQLIEKAGS